MDSSRGWWWPRLHHNVVCILISNNKTPNLDDVKMFAFSGNMEISGFFVIYWNFDMFSLLLEVQML
jgi:hypothetical protein